MFPPALEDRFENRGELGRGGSAYVYEAYDRNIQRSVALKVAREELSPEDRRRFQTEARVTASLDHANIVPVHDLFLDEHGEPFAFAMKLIRGQALSSALGEMEREGDLRGQIEQLLPVLVRASEALAFAHSRGVVHRDINPRNLMLGSFGEVYVADWGLALDQPARSHTAEVSGTPAYMAPEQAKGELDRIGAPTDVFGVGATLYELLTGRPPYHGRSFADLLEQATRCKIVPPEQAASSRDLPGGLCTIVMKALDPNPSKRHQNAEELQADLMSFVLRGGWFPRAHFARGEVIVRAGDRGDRAYLVVSGRCEIYRDLDHDPSPLREVGPGEVFGEVGLFTGAARTATVRAAQDTDVLIVNRDALDAELERAPWMRALLRAAGDRFLELELDAAQAGRRSREDR